MRTANDVFDHPLSHAALVHLGYSSAQSVSLSCVIWNPHVPARHTRKLNLCVLHNFRSPRNLTGQVDGACLVRETLLKFSILKTVFLEQAQC
jgi:hypothetical protein